MNEASPTYENPLALLTLDFPAFVSAEQTQAPEIATGSKPTTALPKKRPKAARPTFQWDQPRPYRVVHSLGEDKYENTLFWVVPSTSGLVRVQVSHCQSYLMYRRLTTNSQLPEQIEHFAALRRTIEAVQDGRLSYDMFKEVDPDGVAATVALIPE